MTQLRGHESKLSKTYARTEAGRIFSPIAFLSNVDNGWNQLSSEAVMAPTLTSFKTRLELSRYHLKLRSYQGIKDTSSKFYPVYYRSFSISIVTCDLCKK